MSSGEEGDFITGNTSHDLTERLLKNDPRAQHQDDNGEGQLGAEDNSNSEAAAAVAAAGRAGAGGATAHPTATRRARMGRRRMNRRARNILLGGDGVDRRHPERLQGEASGGGGDDGDHCHYIIDDGGGDGRDGGGPGVSDDHHDINFNVGGEEQPQQQQADDTALVSGQRQQRQATSSAIQRNFIWMSVLFSANHGCVVSCLSLATTRLGSEVGAWQGGVLYASYTGSALLGATHLVKTLGSRNALVAGMGLYVAYVSCFFFATAASSSPSSSPSSSSGQSAVALLAYAGALLGGIGAGFLWVAQGTYFAQASERHARCFADHHHHHPVSMSTSQFAGIFAFIYLAEEVLLRSLSTFMLEFVGWSWSAVFATYTVITVLSALLMVSVRNYGNDSTGDEGAPPPSGYSTGEDEEEREARVSDGTVASTTSRWYKVTAALQLLVADPKMKYMVGLNAVFGFAGAFLNSYVNGEVVPVVFGHHSSGGSDSGSAPSSSSSGSKYVGILSAWVSIVAAAMSLVFGKVADRTGNGPILVAGAICFLCVAAPFLVVPYAQRWSYVPLIGVYTCHGIGRATFEGALKATFADYFPQEKEGAFANIILQNGLSSAIGYVLTFVLLCGQKSPYCVEYRDGSLHDVLSLELLVAGSAVVAILGFWRASILHRGQEGSYQRVPTSSSPTTTAFIPTSTTTAAVASPAGS